MNEHINRITEAFSTSNAPLSRQICKDLDSKGPMGELASLLFKTEKAVKQAQTYVGRAPVSGISAVQVPGGRTARASQRLAAGAAQR